jgi:hypothetical protein
MVVAKYVEQKTLTVNGVTAGSLLIIAMKQEKLEGYFAQTVIKVLVNFLTIKICCAKQLSIYALDQSSSFLLDSVLRLLNWKAVCLWGCLKGLLGS